MLHFFFWDKMQLESKIFMYFVVEWFCSGLKDNKNWYIVSEQSKKGLDIQNIC